MGPIAIVEAVATLLWCYAGLAGLEWALRMARTERVRHVPLVAELVGHVVPAMIMLVVVVLAGALLGFPTVVVVIAVLFPAGLAWGLHGALDDVRRASLAGEAARIAAALVLGGAVIWLRQGGG